MPQLDPPSPQRLALSCHDGAILRAERFRPEQPRSPSAVVCHPHPLHGGTMYNHVVSMLCRSLLAAGSIVLRFNFRGTSGSTGTHGRGIDEQRDVEAALDHLAHLGEGDMARGEGRRRHLGLVVAGYSFGADVALAVDRPGIAGWIAAAPPLSVLPPKEYRAGRSPRPVLILTGDQDEFCSPRQAEARTTEWIATEVVPLPNENHMLATAEDDVTRHIARFMADLDRSA